jgi:hypothetical protein
MDPRFYWKISALAALTCIFAGTEPEIEQGSVRIDVRFVPIQTLAD